MGLIKLAVDTVKDTLADQWKEYFYCEAISEDVLVTKGQKKISGKASNTKGNDNIISKGSVIAVADGQCMLIVDQGKVVEICAEPGAFVYDSSTEPSIFAGGLGDLGTNILESIKEAGRRITFGGNTAREQRVYYINTKEIINNRFGTATPIPFRVVDSKIGLDVDVSVRCNGIFTYKIANPVIFYSSLSGNVEEDYRKDRIYETMRSELLNSLGPAFSKISDMEVRPNQIVGKNKEVTDALKVELTEQWSELRGIELVKVSFNSVSIPEEDQEMIKQYQKTAVLRDPGMAAASLVESQGAAMKAAASNENGAMMGFMGMGMAQQAGGMNANQLFQMAAANQQQTAQMQAMQQQPVQQATESPATAEAPVTEEAPAKNSWTCVCGKENTGKFCVECGTEKPEKKLGWTCACGALNTGKFCPECGAKKPAEEPLYKCDKCGWEPEDPKNPPKFCPECGDPFNDDDIIQ